MTFVLVVGFGIALIVWTVALLDWLARRKDKRASSH
jgi:hypothetical protein